MTPDSLLRTLVGISRVGLDTALFASSAWVGATFLGPTHSLVNGCYRKWSQGVLRACGAELRTRGDAHLDPSGRFVLVSNHLSDLDAPAIIASFGHHDVRFVAKQELARIPLFGHALRATGNVIVTRSDTRADVDRLDAQRKLLERVSVLFFAEGTRSTTGELGPFKRGAAAFALKTGMPVVPIGVHGTFEILPRGLRLQGSGCVGVSVGEPLPVAGRDVGERGALTEELRELVETEVERARELSAGSA